MANSLNRHLIAGEIVIVRRGYLKPEFRSDPRFRCNGGGFGSQPFTEGRKAYGTWLIDGSDDFLGGLDIDVVLTKHYQSVHGVYYDGPIPPAFTEFLEEVERGRALVLSRFLVDICIPGQIYLEFAKLPDYAKAIHTRLGQPDSAPVSLLELVLQAEINGDIFPPDSWELKNDDNQRYYPEDLEDLANE